MRSFKELKTNIEEAMGTAAAGGNDQYGGSAPHVDGRMTFAGNEELRMRINGFIKRQLAREFFNPEMCFNMLRAKLNVVGLDFKVNESIKGIGTVEFPMTRHGGAFGTTPNHDLSNGFYDENGFEGNVDHVLRGTVEMGAGGGYSIDVAIETASGEG